MKETIKLGLTLLIIAAISGAVLAGTNAVTGPIIEEMKKEAAFGAYFEIFEDADDFEELEEDLLNEVMEAEKAVVEGFEALDSSGENIGYILKVKSGGYGGDMFTAVGIDSEGLVKGIQVVDHSETPSIGDKVEGDSFTESFREKSTDGDLVAVDNPSGDNEVQGISGSTVSVNAVLNGVNKALGSYRDILAE